MTEGSIAESWRRSPASLSRARRLASTQRAPLLLVSSVAIGAVILLGRLTDGWFRHDDGSLAHEAQRVLAGDLPHRDFADLYTGLLSFVNAGVFAVLGDDIANLRVPLFVAFLAFLAAFFALALKAKPAAAKLAGDFDGSAEWILAAIGGPAAIGKLCGDLAGSGVSAAINLASFSGGRRHEPDLPPLARRVEKRSITHAISFVARFALCQS